MANDYEGFKKNVYALTSIDLNSYKERQMKRRIDTLIAKNKYPGYDEYIAAIKKDKALFEEFVNYLTINVSEFYRNPEQWKILESDVFPELVKKYGKNAVLKGMSLIEGATAVARNRQIGGHKA